MRRVISSAMVFVAVAFMSASATIINIPDDYPTIQQGIDASIDGDTVLVQLGTYVESIGFGGHNIMLGSLFLTTGDSAYIAETIIDGDSSGRVVSFGAGEDTTAMLIGFTIQNGVHQSGGGIYCGNSSQPIIKNNIIRDNHATPYTGGGIWCRVSDPRIIDNVISNNTAESGGGGISLLDSSPLISGNLIADNSSGSHGGGILCFQSNPEIRDNMITGNYGTAGGGIGCTDSHPLISGNIISGNSGSFSAGISLAGSNSVIRHNIITDNLAEIICGGIRFYESSPHLENNVISRNTAVIAVGGISCDYFSNPVILNTILWEDDAPAFTEIFIDTSSSPAISYCDVQGGLEGEGNIDVDPLFRDPQNGDFHLMSTECGDQRDSPCIDAGSPAIIDSLLDCSWGLGTILSDMGAHGGGDSVTVGIDGQHVVVPRQFALTQNYPNPFNSSTIIRYNLPVASDVAIVIYDILGRKVETLVQGQQPAGYHQVIWDADDKSSGMYFYRIQAGEYSETRKMVLLK